MSFTDFALAPNILKAVVECGYTDPTPIQARAIPLALAGRDLIATAQTGTGKTAAFVLPALQRLGTPPTGRGRGPRILVLTPTRELANQVTEAVRNYGRHLRIRSGAILGGMPYPEQQRLLAASVDLIVATPGRLIDHLERGRLDLSRLEILVLDEADRMLDMGFAEDVDKIAAATPAGRQTLLFTATLDTAMARLAGRLLRDPERIEVTGEKVTLAQIEQRLHHADDLDHKQRLLGHLIADKELGTAIIFSATKRDADGLAVRLRAQGHAAAALHGDMSQRERNRTITDLRRGKVRLLVATDVAARGLDIPGISHVINFDLPKFAEDYVHRIGRTGRAGATGIAISFASRQELAALGRIEKFIGQAMPVSTIPGLEPTRPLFRPSARPQGRAGTGRPGAPRRSGSPSNPGRGGKWAKPGTGREPLVEYRSSKPGRPARQVR
jgi:superfamily II DNA/RNA helicase